MTKLDELGVLIQRAKDYQSLMEQQEASLKKTEELIAQIIETDIPHLMDSLGMAKIDTVDGMEVKVVDTYHASITEKRREEAFRWLRENGHEALIKNEVKIAFDAGEDDAACAVAQSLTEKGFPVTMREAVNPNTLKGFVREQKENGQYIPDDVFGIFHKREAKIKRKT